MGCRGASGGGGFSQARKPGAAQEFWLELRAFPPGPAGRDPGRAAAGRRGAALCRAGTMRPLLCALAGLALLRAAGSLAAAEPFSPPRGDSAQSTVCDRHMAVQRRLDVMEEVTGPRSWSPAAGGGAPARQHPQSQPCPLAVLPQLHVK
ncbi:placenta-specific protein 9 isoform X2 [Papio anubis]|uniref:placenta-specific protein 9 isoform X2 n=1 Tax=Papio anubis TaxID=9555 RepID=UPI0012AE96FA|nr:placenta-specific protein 9 isoform X2 [Papio anubis]